MTSSEKLRVLFIRDAITFVTLTIALIMHSQLSMVPILIGILAGRQFAKKLKGATTPLEPAHRRSYFASTCIAMLIWLGLLVFWVVRHASPQSWLFGSLGLVILLVCWYSAYDQVYGAAPKV
jgi:hypothetical protein